MLSATVVAVLLSFVGGFALGDDAAGLRTVYVVLMFWIGAVLDMLAYAIALRLPRIGERFWTRVLMADLLVTLPAALLIWASTWMFGRDFGWQALPLFLLNTFIVTGAFIAGVVAPVMDGVALKAEPEPAGIATANFMDRLPAHLAGSELWALKAEDHYLQVLTSKGSTLIRLRMADALRELGAVPGAQTHRSWWVARAAVRSVRKGEGSVSLVLPDGLEVPVSRNAARSLRAAGWY